MVFYGDNPQLDTFSGSVPQKSEQAANASGGPPTDEELKNIDPPEWMLSTLDESVGTTFKREFSMMGKRTLQILWVFKSTTTDPAVYETYDYVGPIFWLTLYALFLAIASVDNNGDAKTNASTMSIYFVIAFGIYFIVSPLIAFNTNVVGGHVHLPSTVCLLGYCMMPLAAYTLVAMIMKLLTDTIPDWIRTIVVSCTAALACAWSTYAAYAFFKTLTRPGKVFMTLYPIILFFIVFAVLGLVGAQMKKDALNPAN